MTNSKKKTKKKKVEEPKEQREFKFDVNVNCPYQDENCGTRLPCLCCCYDTLVEGEQYLAADKMYIQFESHLKDKVTRHSIEIDNFRRPVPKEDGPTQTQLNMIKIYLKDKPMPEITTKQEAKELIQTLRKV